MKNLIHSIYECTENLRYYQSFNYYCLITTDVSQENCATECILSIDNLTIGDCDDNGTAADASDDTYVVTFNISGVDAGSDGLYFVINGMDTLATFEYQTEQSLTLDANGEVNTMTFVDIQIEECQTQFTLTQDDCSTEEINELNLVMPNVFSPNGDGSNDTWSVFILNENIRVVNCDIYDRWGSQIYTTTDVQIAWDGSFHGRPANVGVYVYQLVYLDEYGNQMTKTGDITLLR